MNILFVCTGNTCRSPMAQGILQAMAEEKNMDIVVKSAGIYALDGQRAALNAIKALQGDNIDISNHRANTIHKDLIKEADLIFTMGNSHKDILINNYDFAKNKIYTLKEFAYGRRDDVEDPFGGDIHVYNHIKDEIYNTLEKVMEKLMKGEY